MKAVDPAERVCLFLDNAHMPFSIATARAAFQQLCRKRGQAIDASGNYISWDDLEYFVPYKEQPVMRSSTQVWIVPTIFVVNEFFYYRMRKRRGLSSLPSLKFIHKHYKGVCQICLEKKPYTEFSRDHVFPKALGGSNDLVNIVLACKRCNSLKGHAYPYLNKFGVEVKPKIYANAFFVPDEKLIRSEWRPFLFHV
jgi:5-methylcytosine-specific restriction endonuclease McrA